MTQNSMTEKMPDSNLLVGTWIRLLSKFSSEFIKRVEKMDDPETFARRILHVRMTGDETNDLERIGRIDDKDALVDLNEEFEDIMCLRDTKDLIAVVVLSKQHEDLIKKLIPYGLRIKFIKNLAVMHMDWEGQSYFNDCVRRRGKKSSSDAFADYVIKIAKKDLRKKAGITSRSDK